MAEFKVTCTWDDEAGVYYVAESNVPGLSAESQTVEGIQAILQDRIPELVRLKPANQALFMIIVQPDKVAKCDREFDVLDNIKWVKAQSIFQSSNDQRKTQ